MSKESRSGYEFGSYSKRAIDSRTKKRCVVTGSKKATQRHHMLPIWMVHEFLPDHSRRVIRSGHNGTTLRSDIHEQLHQEMYDWSHEMLQTFAIGLYAYLEEQHYKNVLEPFRPETYNNRKLTDNKLK